MDIKKNAGEVLDKVQGFIEENAEGIRTMLEVETKLPIEEKGKKELMDRLDLSEEDAADASNDILAGVNQFAQRYEAYNNAGRVTAAETMAELTEELSSEAKAMQYAQLLTALQIMRRDEEFTDQELAFMLRENYLKPTDEQANEIDKFMNEEYDLSVLRQVLTQSNSMATIREMAEVIGMGKSDIRYLMGVELYIAQHQGLLKLTDSGNAFNAQMIGTLVGAATETFVVTQELNEGKIELTAWQKALKKILGALIFAAMTVVSTLLLLAVVAPVAILTLGLIGPAVLSYVVCLGITIPMLQLGAEWALRAERKALHFLSDLYDRKINPVTDRTRAFMERLRETAAGIEGKITQTVVGPNATESKATVSQPEEMASVEEYERPDQQSVALA